MLKVIPNYAKVIPNYAKVIPNYAGEFVKPDDKPCYKVKNFQYF